MSPTGHNDVGTDSTVAPARVWLWEVDGLRAIAFLLIVVGHAVGILAGLAHSPADMGFFGALLALTRFALPAFMMISALLITRSLADGRHRRSYSRLLVPYSIWTLLYIFVARSAQGGPAGSLGQVAQEYVRAFLTGTGYYHLWYVPIAVQIVAITPMVARTMLPWTPQRRWAVLGLVVLANIVLLGQVWGPITELLPGSLILFGSGADRIIFFWSSYVVLGIVIGADYDGFMRMARKYRFAMRTVYLMLSVAQCVLVWRQAMVVSGDYAATANISKVMQPWILPFELLSIVVWMDLGGMLARGRMRKTVSMLSTHSFGGYLIHPLFILAATEYVYLYFASPNPPLTVMVVSAAGLVGGVGLTWLAARVSIPLGGALTGAIISGNDDRRDSPKL